MASIVDIASLYSPLAKGGPPPFFAKPEGVITYDFDQGLAAPETFPIDDLSRIAESVANNVGTVSLEYFDPQFGYGEMTFGNTVLRRALADRMAERDGRRPDDADIMLTSGSVQGIALAINAFLGPGDAVIVEAASFPYALRYMEGTGAHVYTVPVDDEGMDIDVLATRLEEISEAGLRPKMIYTIATFQLPTGVVLSLRRRRQLLELAERWNVLVLEDNVYGELRYEGDPVPTLLSLDWTGLVLHADSFSKTVAPALRLGWVVGSPEVLAGLAAVRQDLGVSQSQCRVMAQYLTEGLFEPHLDLANQVYLRKRDVAVAALREHCSAWLTFRVPQGGFYLWLELASNLDHALVQELTRASGVYCRPGEMFMGAADDRHYMRMAFSHISDDEISRGVAALGEALAQAAP